MSVFGDDSGYRIARWTLIEGIRALSAFPRSSVVLVGAHAVYHHAPDTVGAMTPFTLDGDLAVDPRLIEFPQKIYDALDAAGFSLRSERFGGLYKYDRASSDDEYAARLDIFVPAAFARQWNFDRYDKMASLAVFNQEGLELCLIDHAPMKIGPIGSEETVASIEVEVAGVLALLVAKGYKIGERFAQGPEAFQGVQKDVADIYRLLAVSSDVEIAKKVEDLGNQPQVRGVARVGASYIRTLCGPRGAGCELLSQALGSAAEASIILESLEILAERFANVVDATL
jgi:hypothetical protein